MMQPPGTMSSVRVLANPPPLKHRRHFVVHEDIDEDQVEAFVALRHEGFGVRHHDGDVAGEPVEQIVLSELGYGTVVLHGHVLELDAEELLEDLWGAAQAESEQ